jgi:hypothetical protein
MTREPSYAPRRQVPVATSDNSTKLNKLHRNSADLVNPGKETGLDKRTIFWDHPP